MKTNKSSFYDYSIKPERIQYEAIDNIKHHHHISFPYIMGKNILLWHTINKAGSSINDERPIIFYGHKGVGKEIFARAIHVNYNGNHKFNKLSCYIYPPDFVNSLILDSKAFYNIIKVSANGTLYIDGAELMQHGTLKHLLNRAKQCNIKLMFGTVSEVFIDKYKNAFHLLEIPDMSSKRENTKRLLNYYIRLISKKNKEYGFEDAAADILITHKWEGNLDELIAVTNHIRVSLKDDNMILRKHLPLYMQMNSRKAITIDMQILAGAHDKTLKNMLALVEKNIIKNTIKHAYNKSEAIRLLGLSRRSFYWKLKKYKIRWK